MSVVDRSERLRCWRGSIPGWRVPTLCSRRSSARRVERDPLCIPATDALRPDPYDAQVLQWQFFERVRPKQYRGRALWLVLGTPGRLRRASSRMKGGTRPSTRWSVISTVVCSWSAIATARGSPLRTHVALKEDSTRSVPGDPRLARESQRSRGMFRSTRSPDGTRPLRAEPDRLAPSRNALTAVANRRFADGATAC